MCRYLTAEEPRVISAVTSRSTHNREVEDYANVTMRTPSGVIFHTEASYTFPGAGGDQERKLSAQEEELALVEREVSEMTAALKGALAGATTGTPLQNADAAAELDAMLDSSAGVAEEIDALGRASHRSAREAEADRLLAELKRKMGK